MKEKLIVLIDADDTLLDFQQCEQHAIEQVAKMLEVEDVQAFASTYHKVNDGVWKEFEKGLITTEQINYLRFDRMFELYNIKDKDSTETGNYYKDRLSEQAILFDGAREFLEEAFKRYRLVMVTNGITYTQQRRFKKADLNKYFEKIFVSEQIGVRKPQKEFFDYVEKNMVDYNNNRVVLVGDSLTSDIAGGENANIKTIWFNIRHKINDTSIKPDYEVDNYKDLLSLLADIKSN